jgi:hypothetical protein
MKFTCEEYWSAWRKKSMKEFK